MATSTPTLSKPPKLSAPSGGLTSDQRGGVALPKSAATTPQAFGTPVGGDAPARPAVVQAAIASPISKAGSAVGSALGGAIAKSGGTLVGNALSKTTAARTSVPITSSGSVSIGKTNPTTIPASATSPPTAPTSPPTAPTGSPDPGMPDTGASVPLTSTGITDRSNATQAYGIAQSEYNSNLYNAALAYGDPNLEGLYGVATPNPNGALELDATKAMDQNQNATDKRADVGTLFSSLHGQDTSQISDAQNRANLAAYQKYQEAMAKANDALSKAYQVEQQGIQAGDTADVSAANAALPASGGATTGAAVNVPSTSASKVKVPSTKTPATTRTTTKSVSNNSVGKGSPTQVKVPKVKVGTVKK